MRRIAVSGLAALAAVLGLQVAVAVTVPAAASSVAAAVPAGHDASSPTGPDAAKPERFLLALSCTSTRFCMAVGEDERTRQPLTETWNGAKWTASDLKLPAGAAAATLYWVSCSTAKNCIAVGETASNTTDEALTNNLAESWNGRSWSASRPPAPSGTIDAGLGGISCVSPTHCVTTGASYLADGRRNAFADVLSGSRWTVDKPPGFSDSGYNSILENVACMSSTSCVAVGSYGNTNSPGGAAPSTVVAAVFWNGKKWSLSKLPVPAGSKGAWLFGVSCLRSKTCVAVGGRGLGGNKSTTLVETWKAGKWRAVSTQAAGSDPSLYAVACASATRCLAGGGGDYSSVVNSNKSVRNNAFSDSWNGTSWTYAKLPTPPEGGGENASVVSAIYCQTAASCVAVGSAGPATAEVYGFSAFWNGKSWRLVPTE